MGLTGLLFLVAFMVGCILALVRHPIYGAIVYVAMVFLDPNSRWWGQSLPDVRWSLISAGVTLLSLLILQRNRPSPTIRQHGAFVILLVLIGWAIVQSPWALDADAHAEFLTYYIKYCVAMYLLYCTVNSEKHFVWMLWLYVLGCLYLASVAFSGYTGGRFDTFGGSGIGDANAGALTLATGIFIGASLFLYSSRNGRIVLLLILPFLVNALVMTASRSGFLALAVGGLAFNWFTPVKLRRRVMGLSALALLAFLMLTNPFYWERMQTVKYGGTDVVGVETGGARRSLFRAQLLIFREHPFGCGHMCTEFLSPRYLQEKDLSSYSGKRSSHNTFLSLLVDQGVIGGAAYLMLLLWIYRALGKLYRPSQPLSPLLTSLLPGIAASLAALTVSDQFVPNVKYELRYWLLTFLMLMVAFAVRQGVEAPATDQKLKLGRAPELSRRRAAVGSSVTTVAGRSLRE